MTTFVFSHANAEYDQNQIKASSRQAQSQVAATADFVFVRVKHGEDDEERKKDSQRVVRSRATAYSHRIAPRGASKPDMALKGLRNSADSVAASRRVSLQSARSSPSASSSGQKTRKRVRHSPQPGPTSTTTTSANIARKRTRLAVKQQRVKRKTVKPGHVSRTPSPSSIISRGGRSDRSRRSSRSDSSPLSSASSRSLSPGAVADTLPDLTYMDASHRDPFDSSPVRYRSWYGKLISFWYNVVFTRSTRVLKASKPAMDAYTVWSRRQELAEPALFYCALFLASGIPVAEGLFPVEAALWLRYKTVEAMKEALRDPERSLSTPVILAVGRIALHEHIYGNRELAHGVHRPAQLRMIQMRGGLANMGLPATTIQLIIWTDALLSAEAGAPAYFADVPKQMAIQSYSPEEAMHVTNYCSPKRNAHPGYGKTQTESDSPPPPIEEVF